MGGWEFVQVGELCAVMGMGCVRSDRGRRVEDTWVGGGCSVTVVALWWDFLRLFCLSPTLVSRLCWRLNCGISVCPSFRFTRGWMDGWQTLSDTAVGISFYVALFVWLASISLMGFYCLRGSSFPLFFCCVYFYHIFNSAEESGLLRMRRALFVCVCVCEREDLDQKQNRH